jgi:predicted nucleic acid-binding protein
LIIATLDYCPFDRQVWLRAADLWAELRRRGVPLQDADILIAAQALELGAVLATNNERHFSPFVPFGLRIEDWTK